QLLFLFPGGSARMTPPAPVADGVEIDADGKREHLATRITAIEILAEPTQHVFVVEDLACTRKMRWYRPILIAGEQRETRPNARQDFLEKLGQGSRPPPDQMPVAHAVVPARVESQGRLPATASLLAHEGTPTMVLAHECQPAAPNEAGRLERPAD